MATAVTVRITFFRFINSSAVSARSFPDYSQLEKSRLPLVAIASPGRAGPQRVGTILSRQRAPVPDAT
jgi:hypothetical protein